MITNFYHEFRNNDKYESLNCIWIRYFNKIYGSFQMIFLDFFSGDLPSNCAQFQWKRIFFFYLGLNRSAKVFGNMLKSMVFVQRLIKNIYTFVSWNCSESMRKKTAKGSFNQFILYQATEKQNLYVGKHSTNSIFVTECASHRQFQF